MKYDCELRTYRSPGAQVILYTLGSLSAKYHFDIKNNTNVMETIQK